MDELKDALKVSLANRGVLDEIKARIRAEVFSAIESEAVRAHVCSSTHRIVPTRVTRARTRRGSSGRAEAGSATRSVPHQRADPRLPGVPRLQAHPFSVFARSARAIIRTTPLMAPTELHVTRRDRPT